MFDWTQFDMVRIEQERYEERLRQKATAPQPSSRRPIRSALAATLMTLARRLADEQPSGSLATGGAESELSGSVQNPRRALGAQ